ncbi:MAG: acetyl-CoA C-acetyltransferase [Actinobacteria bacterium]|nr:acetyl-CoA C-acetyltransferase [Actinomycetota bacterium]
MTGPVIIAGARTPIGRFNGGLSGFSAQELGGLAIAGALTKAGVSPDQVDYVYMGQVVQAGQGQITARQAAVNAGIPMSVPATTVNKVCLSGLNTIYLAHQMIAAGDAEIVVAGGMESMSNAPYVLDKARRGYGYGNAEMLDSLYHDGLYCAFDACAMGLGTERYAEAEAEVTRLAMDNFSATSHDRADAARSEGRFDAEIVAVSVPQRKGDPIVISADEGIRPGTTVESLSRLRPAFSKDGSITAANASQISDGASAIVMMSQAKADELGLSAIAELVSYGQIAGPDSASLLTQPSQAIKSALGKTDLEIGDIDLFEINEAFAAVGLCSMTDLGIDDSLVNVDGGAIALGHPIGMSGNRLALHMINELIRRGGGIGAAALCGGGGQGDAGVFRTL